MKKISVILIALAFFAFTFCILYTRNSFRVLKVYSPSLIAIDLNKNDQIEENEKLQIDGIESFTSKITDFRKDFAGKYPIEEETALSIGYFAEKFAQNLIENKKVQYKKLKNGKIILYFNGRNYNKIFTNSPFAMKDGKPINEENFKKQIELAKNIELRIYNNKSDKYHHLNCEYGQIAGDSIILPKKQLPKTAQSCKFCQTQKDNIPQDNTQKVSQEQSRLKNIKPQKFSVSTEKIKLILTDFSTVFVTNKKCTTEYCVELLRQINNSQKTIDMALYGYTDIPDITTAIQNAIRRGVVVRMVYDVNETNENFYPDTFRMAQTLAASKGDYGSKQYQKYIMHNKFFIIDKKTVITGSANISTTDLSGYNTNDIVIIESPEIAEIYEQEFEQMYENKFHNKKSKIQNNENILIGDSIISVYFSPQDNIAENVIIPLINKAKNYIYIPMFVITHKKICQALEDARARNVDVKVILDATNASNKYTTHELLRKNGVQVKTENFAGKMHSKSMIIDDLYTVMGSMNFSKSGNNNNDENIIVIENSKIAKYYKNFFLYLWQKIPDIWLVKNASSESYDSIGSCFDEIDNDFDGKIDMEDSGCEPYKINFSAKNK